MRSLGLSVMFGVALRTRKTAPRIRSLTDLAARIAEDQNLAARIKEDPERTIAGLASASIVPVPDTWIYRIVVISLGLALVLCVVGAIILARDKSAQIPDILLAVESATVGALAGLLAPSPSTQQ